MNDAPLERIVLLAGLSGSGKSTFLADPARFLPQPQLPVELRDLHALAPDHRPLKGFRAQSPAQPAARCVHADLSWPLRALASGSRADLLEQLRPALYAAWDDLLDCVRGAAVVDVVSFYCRREVHFRRWLYGKHFTRNPGGGTRSAMVAIHADDTDDDALHGAVHRAWFGFLRSVPMRSHYVIDASAEPYRVFRAARFSARMGWLDTPHEHSSGRSGSRGTMKRHERIESSDPTGG